jgi:hypothetical protein
MEDAKYYRSGPKIRGENCFWRDEVLKTRLLAVLLTLCLGITLLQTAALAGGEAASAPASGESTFENTQSVTSTRLSMHDFATATIEDETTFGRFSSLQEAVNHVEDGQTILLHKDVTSSATVNRTVTFTLDLGGNTFTGMVSGSNSCVTVVSETDEATGLTTYTCTYTPAEKENCPSEGFTDVDTGKWYHNAVDYVLAKGIMEGNGNGTFAPGGTLTRAQLAQILYNVAGRPEVTVGSPFTDVPSGKWYTNAITWASEAGIVEGYGDGTFGPMHSVSRQDLAVMLWRYAGKPKATQTSLNFTDADMVSDYAQAALLWANEVGIVQGSSGKLNPKGSATRAEAAAMIMRYLELG